MKRCDICSNEGVYLVTLSAEYQTKEIQDACQLCEKEVNDVIYEALRKMDRMKSRIRRNIFHRFLGMKRKVKQETP